MLRTDTYFPEYFPKRIENLVQKQSQFLHETQRPGEQKQFLGQYFGCVDQLNTKNIVR